MTGEQTDAEKHKAITYRRPESSDGQKIYQLIKSSPPLDLNSLYHYLIFCHYYNETSIIAEVGNDVIGFISGFITPTDSKKLFIWQVVVDASCRGKGVSLKMLSELVSRQSCRSIEYIETTVTPSNSASRAMFASFAKVYEADIKESVLFPSTLFGNEGHEEEVLFSIGPLQR